MKKIYSITLIIFSIVVLIGCGGGGGSSFSQQKDDIVIVCTTVAPAVPTAVDIATYHELFTGDIIVKDTPATIVQLYTPVGANSRVCLQSGQAHIVRK